MSKRCAKILFLCASALAAGAIGDVAKADVPALKVGTAPLVSPSAALTYYGSPSSPTPPVIRDTTIQERARALNYDIDQIYISLRDNVDVIPIFALQKGAKGVILDNSGTAFDIAHAMVEMLREADAVSAKGYNPTYRMGVITLTGAQFASWFGISNADAARAILADGGIPASVVSSGATITSVQMLHVWVDAVIGGTHYLFDPAFKSYTSTSPIDVASAMSFSGPDLRAAGDAGATSTATSILAFNQSSFRTKLTQFRTTLEQYLRTNHPGQRIEAVVGERLITPSGLPPRSTSLAYVTSTDRTWTGDIPNSLRTAITVSLNGSAYGTYYADQIYGRFLAFGFTNGASGTARGAVVDRIYGIAEHCDFFVSGTPAQQVTATIEINHAYAAISGSYMDRTLSKKIVPNRCNGSAFYLTNDWSDTGSEISRQLSKAAVALLERPYGVPGSPIQNSSSYAKITSQYARYVKLAQSLLGVKYQIHDLIGLHHIDRIGLITRSVASGGAVFEQGSEQQMLTTDFEGAISVNPLDLVDGSRRGAASHVAIAGLDFAENGALREENDTVRDMTPLTLFTGQNTLSSSPGNYYYYLANPANWSSIRSSLSAYPAAALSVLDGYIAEGYHLTLPQRGDLRQQPFFVNLGSGATRSTRLVEVYGGSTELTRAVFHAFKPGAAGIDGGAYLIFDPKRGRPLKGGVGVSLIDSAGTLLKTPDRPEKESRQPLFSQVSVNGQNGTLAYASQADLSDGTGEFPYRLEFRRRYTSGDTNDVGLGVGWQHNWMQTISSGNDGAAIIGDKGAQGAAAAIVAIWASNDLMLSAPTPSRLIALANAEKWLADQTIDNVVTVNRAFDGDENFFRQGDGTFISAEPSGSTLMQSGQPADSIVNRLTYRDVSYSYSSSDGSIRNYDFVGMSSVDPAEAASVSSDARKTLYLSNWVMPDGFRIDTRYLYRFDNNLVYFQEAENSLGRFISTHGVDLGDWGDHPTCPNGPNSLIVWVGPRPGETKYQNSAGDEVRFLKTASNQWIAVPNSEGDPPIRCDDKGRVATIFTTHPSTTTSTVDVLGSNWAYGSATATNPYMNFPTIGTVYQPSSSTNAAIEFFYGLRGNIRSVKDARGNSFLYRSSPNRAEIDDPLGNGSVEYFDGFGRTIAAIDSLGNRTSRIYNFRNQVTRITQPELNFTTYTYDVRGNRLSETITPKPGSALTPTSTVTSYVEGATLQTCVNLKRCNRPLTSTDARARVTDYDWDAASGNLLSVTLPADAVGARPKTTYVYSSFPGDSSGGGTFTLPTQRQERISSSVSTTTTFSYGDAANHFGLTGSTVDSGGLALRTCVTLDAIGNPISLTTPNAGLGSCP
ncbi:DUF6531 domain-containing protein [Sphingobium sp. HBC34]|uniref:DUF6531 domain-containing protein n=1 Tax=Sphingobium cyanobacteriorum TaxID=3063954 RepID=A0ABT8ZGK1_9SPHN|nr:DUF6531 domain-containing protein [Sphingobium sp. HBC34]MDO7833668.1 DUF6531 domain-containing protein [Sphingobium sp. HBC34]